MHSNWRDCSGWLEFGVPLSTTSNEACKLYDASLTQYVGWYDDAVMGGIEETMKKCLKADPKFVMGHVIKNGLELMGTATCTRKNSKLGRDIFEMQVLADAQPNLSDSERRHVTAVKLWSEGQQYEAARTWERILMDNPLDILATKFAHDTYFYMGMSFQMRDSLGGTFPKWSKGMPLYGYMHGMYSFGLEETNMFAEAEKMARKGLEINRKDAWCTHTMAHVAESGGRHDEGIKFMKQTEIDWSSCGMLACHNYWHWALHYLEKGSFEEALGVYDNYVGKMANATGMPLDTVDASSLLMRLQMEGAKVGDRWKDLLESVRPHLDDHVLVFNDSHILLACLGAKNTKAVEQLMDSIREWLQTARGDQADITKSVGMNIYQAFIAYDAGNYARAVELLYPIRYDIIKIGGSHAQRDLYNLFLIQAALKSKKSEHHRMAKALLMERKSQKDCSPLTDRLVQNTLQMHIK